MKHIMHLIIMVLFLIQLQIVLLHRNLTNKINLKLPSVLSVLSGSYAHAVLTNGYTTSDGNKKVVFWNSRTSSYESFLYSSKIFAYSELTWTWTRTVY